MHRNLMLAALACVALAGCESTADKIVGNLSECTRDYDVTMSGGVTGGAGAVSGKVHCEPQATAAKP